MAEKDLYKLLGVAKTASTDEIKKAFKRQAMKYHPDRNPDPGAIETFKDIKQAYDILSDPQKRATYDNHGFDAANGGFSHNSAGGFEGFEDFADIFSNIFGGGRKARPNQQTKGDDLLYRLQLTLEEAAFGCTKEIEIKTLRHCKKCGGSGKTQKSEEITCSTCRGAGKVRVGQGFFSISQVCQSCKGAGKIIKNPCDVCAGEGVNNVNVSESIKIPAGIDSGNRIRLTGKGEAGRKGGPIGDLYIEIALKKHPVFVRQKNDLYCELPISFATAALGGEVDVPVLKGRVQATIPPETQSGKKFRIKGQGIKSVRGGGRGDLYCTVYIETPVNLSPEQKKLLIEFDKSLKEEGEKHSPKEKGLLDKVKGFFDI